MVSSPPRPPPPARILLPDARQIFQNAYFTVRVDDRLRIIHAARSALAFPTLQMIETAVDEMGDVLDELGRARYVILADVRAVVGRNDPEFEEAMARALPRWLGGYRKVGVIVQTAIGQLQIQRHIRRDGIERLVSSDETELLNYLTRDE